MWVARDKNGGLYLYKNKPVKSLNRYWHSEPGDCFEISSYLFPEVKWEDEEPRELVLEPLNEE